MYCPKCGIENPDNAHACRACGAQLLPPPPPPGGIVPKTSGLAIAAFVLAVVSFAIFPVGLIAIILGIAGIIVIEKSGGRLTGRVFAVLGILIPVFVFCLLFVLTMTLYPVLTRVKSQARTTACMVNLKQWGLIFSLYTQDNDGYFFGRETDALGCWWMDPLRPYYRDNQRLVFCPEAMKPYAEGHDSSFAAWRIGDDSGSYGLNAWICNPGQRETVSVNQAPVENHWKTPKTKGASNIPVLLDAAWFADRPQDTDSPVEHPGASRDGSEHVVRGMGCFCIDRHSGCSNAVFMDWSVRRVGIKELWTLKWHREFDTEGPWTRAGGVQPSDWPPWMRNFRDY
ncbi:MAG TPA: zinc ribbon domain-containing protein [Sedimentisphaerales bacterium]|nr:zinc ribbon domain-containing protein [Sedimentisphaerales bacterium]